MMHLARPICRYGIVLRPVAPMDLERVRQWRNAAHVRSKMEYQAHITPEMQTAWWTQLDLAHNHYYVIEQDGNGVGVIHAKDIDRQARTAETGIFIGEPSYLGTFVSVLAVLALMDHLFEEQHLQKLSAKVKADEPRIRAFNARLGYQEVHERDGFLLLEVDGKAYFEATSSLRKWAGRMSEGR